MKVVEAFKLGLEPVHYIDQSIGTQLNRFVAPVKSELNGKSSGSLRKGMPFLLELAICPV